MFTKDQLEQQLKTNAKSALFDRQFTQAFDKYMNEKRGNANKTYAEQKDWKEYKLNPSIKEVRPFTVEGDDAEFHHAKWASLLRESAFYFDLPTL